MMVPDFRTEALAFVREHQCAEAASLPLIEKAMRQGAGLMAADALKLVAGVRQRLKSCRDRNL